MARNLTTGLQRGLRQSIAGGLGAGDIFSTASLDLNFARHKSLDSRITFSRASSGTYVDAAGVIRTAGNNVARFDHNPTTGESLGLLVEESRTNLITDSETIGGTGWTQVGTGSNVVTLNDSISPDGTQTATRIDFSRTSTTQYELTKPSSAVSATGLTQGSVFVKAATASDVGKVIDLWQFQGGVRNQSTATLTNEWQRVSLVNTYSHTGSINEALSIGLLNNTGGGELNVSVLLWGAQLEAGSFPTSYIRTTGSTATRSADVASITGTNFSSWYNQTEGTVFSNTVSSNTVTSTNDSAWGFDVDATTVNNRLWLYHTKNQAIGSDSGPTQYSLTGGTINAGQTLKAGFAFKENDIAYSPNSASPLTDTSATLPTVDRLYIGKVGFNDSELNGTISRLTYWPTRLSNDTLQTITR